jgi:hypothetical protein
MSNVCNCPKPPGGSIQCSDEQLAVCGYQDGQIVSGCFDRPAYVLSIINDNQKNLVLANWVISRITGITRDDHAPLERELSAMLAGSRYRNDETGEVIRFSLPKDLDLQSAAKWKKGTIGESSPPTAQANY